MLIHKELPIPFAVYDNVLKQSRFQENCKGGCAFRLLTPPDRMLPFQFYAPIGTALAVTSWQVMNIDGTVAYDLTAQLGLMRNKALPQRGERRFYYLGESLSLFMEEGRYYSQIVTTGGVAYYTEEFYVSTAFSNPAGVPFIKLEWGHPSDIAPILYNTTPPYKNIVYLDTFISVSEPRVEEETVENGEGTEIPVFQRLVVEYRFTVVAPNYLKIALAAAQLHQNITITEPFGASVGDIARFTVTSTPQETTGGCLSVLDCVMEQDLVVVNSRCEKNME